ncbi:hypothetical protein [Streptomyces sp. NPDC018031]|uniref:hypothetical protein n=1 Tax=Streptomyces sp. NPDC018031 TaxID=3365033 RepID=UPI0037BCA6D5
MLWGVAAALLANVLYSTGFVLEKRALAGMPPLSATSPARLLRHVLGSPLWLGGAIALALGFGAQLLVYRKLPIAAAQGLFVSGLVLLVVLSSVVLGERPSGRERRSVVIILGALVMVVASLHGGTEDISRSAPAGVLLLVCLPSLAAALWLYGAAERRARRRHRLPTTGVAYGVAVGLLYGVSSLAIKGVSGLSAGGGLGGLLTDLMLSPYPYLLVFTGATGLVLSQTALQRCRASLIVPVCTTVTCVFTVACGTVVFGEPLPHEPLRLALRLGGTALAVGVLLALPRHDDAPEAGETAMEAPEEPGAGARPPAGGPGARPPAGPGLPVGAGPLPARPLPPRPRPPLEPQPLSSAHTLTAAPWPERGVPRSPKDPEGRTP